MNDLAAIEGAAGNLRGALFEMIVGYLVREVEGNTIDIGEIVRDPETGETAELDVRRVKEKQECWVYECRGRQPDHRMKTTDVTKWFQKIDVIARVHRAERRFNGCELGFELWTTGGFDEDAVKLLQCEKERRRRTKIDWRDGRAVREYAKRAGRKSILNALDEHYFRHRLARNLD